MTYPNNTLFQIRNLSVLAYANGFTLWHYRTATEKMETVRKPDFFADASDMLAVNDAIIVCATDGVAQLAVSNVSPNSVHTKPFLTLV